MPIRTWLWTVTDKPEKINEGKLPGEKMLGEALRA
jgi:hypothetical protein